MTMIDVKECAIDRSRVVVHIGPFKLLKTLYGSCFMLARKPVPINSGRRKYRPLGATVAAYCSLLLLRAPGCGGVVVVVLLQYCYAPTVLLPYHARAAAPARTLLLLPPPPYLK